MKSLSLKHILALIAILASALFLRLYNLFLMPVFADEAIYVRWAQVMKAEPTLRFLPVSDGKQPLFMWSVMPVLKLVENAVVSGRLVSALSGIGTLVGVVFLVVVLFGNIKKLGDLLKVDKKVLSVGLVSGFLYAFAPYAVFFDRVALVDSMLAMFGVWFAALALLTVYTMRLDLAMISGFALGGAMLTKSPASFFLLLLPSTILFFKSPKDKSDRPKKLLELVGLWGVTGAIGYAMYNVLRLGPNFHVITSRNQDYIYPITHIFERPFDPLIPFLTRIGQYYLILGTCVFVLMVVLAIIFNVKRYWKQILFVSAWVFIPIFVVSEYSQTMTARYVYFTFPFSCVLGSTLFLKWGNFKKKMGKLNLFNTFLVLLLIVFVGRAMQTNYYLLTDPEKANLPRTERTGFLEEWTSGTGIYEASEIIRDHHVTNPSEKIVVGTEGYFGTLPDGMQVYLNDLREITVIGVGLNFEDIPIQLKESAASGNKTYFVVNSSRLKINPDDVGLVKVAEFAKAPRPEGSWEYAQSGPQDYLYLFEVPVGIGAK